MIAKPKGMSQADVVQKPEKEVAQMQQSLRDKQKRLTDLRSNANSSTKRQIRAQQSKNGNSGKGGSQNAKGSKTPLQPTVSNNNRETKQPEPKRPEPKSPTTTVTADNEGTFADVVKRGGRRRAAAAATIAAANATNASKTRGE